MDAYERFKEACKEPVDIDKCREALKRLIAREHTMRVPPTIEDDDILIMRALDELERMRG